MPDSSSSFPEDVLFEIFRRLPFESTCKFRCLSKPWSARLSNPSFINLVFNRLLTRGDTSTPWILVSRYDIHKSSFFSTSFKFVLYKAVLDPNTFRTLFPLASSNGLVLCSASEYCPRNYFICNPLTKQFVALPTPRPNTKEEGCTGFVFESSAGTYKVIHIPFYYQHGKFNLQMFSSDTSEWSTHEVTCSREPWMRSSIYNLVNHSKIWYWIDGGGHGMIAYDNNNHSNGGGECMEFDLPDGKNRVDLPQHCIGESRGLLYYGKIKRVREVSSISVWEFRDGNYNNGWTWGVVCKDAEVQDYTGGLPQLSKIEYSLVAFSPVDPNVVIFKCHQGTDFVYEAAYNIRTRKSQVFRASAAYNIQITRKSGVLCSSRVAVSVGKVGNKEWDPRIVVTLQPVIIPTITR